MGGRVQKMERMFIPSKLIDNKLTDYKMAISTSPN